MKRRLILCGAGLLAWSLASCAVPSQTTVSQTSVETTASQVTVETTALQAVTFTDALGRTVTVRNPQKVAACLASYGEIWQLAGGTLAGVTGEAWSERDMALDGVTNLGKNDAPSVETILAEGYDFVLLSAGKKEQAALADTLDALGISCAFFDVETFTDYLNALKICTDITGRTDLYETNGLACQDAIDAVLAEAAKQTAHPTVLLLRAQSAGVKARRSDNMVGAELRDLGCINIAETDGTLLETLSLEAILNDDPDYIFIVNMGAADEAEEALERQLTADPAWQTLTAVREGHVYTLAKELFQYKPNTRWAEAYRTLYQIIYGEIKA